MTFEEFQAVLEEKKVRHYNVNGFAFYFPNSFYAVLEGRFPLPLARKICEGIDNNKLRIRVRGGSLLWKPDLYATNAELADIIDDMMESKMFDIVDYDKVRENYIRNLDENNRLDELYITQYHVETVEGLRHIIDCIDKSGYVNECLFS